MMGGSRIWIDIMDSIRQDGLCPGKHQEFLRWLDYAGKGLDKVTYRLLKCSGNDLQRDKIRGMNWC